MRTLSTHKRQSRSGGRGPRRGESDITGVVRVEPKTSCSRFVGIVGADGAGMEEQRSTSFWIVKKSQVLTIVERIPGTIKHESILGTSLHHARTPATVLRGPSLARTHGRSFRNPRLLAACEAT